MSRPYPSGHTHHQVCRSILEKISRVCTCHTLQSGRCHFTALLLENSRTEPSSDSSPQYLCWNYLLHLSQVDSLCCASNHKFNIFVLINARFSDFISMCSSVFLTVLCCFCQHHQTGTCRESYCVYVPSERI